MNKQTGVSDSPVANDEQDALGFKSKANVLSRFASNCNTPMTIGIQGGWGSGKTSLMKLVEDRVKETCTVAWVNTWQYAQVYDEAKLPLWIIAGLTRKLLDQLTKSEFAQSTPLLETMLNVGKGLLVNQIGIDRRDLNTRRDTLISMDESTSAEYVRAQFDELVKTIVKNRPLARVVIFIDDIDRVRPEIAVRILEAIKTFLDVEHCVFVLAVDFEIIQAGLKERNALDGRDFFEKIIQVPYSLRPHTFNCDAYVRNHLGSMRDPMAQGEALDNYLLEVIAITTGQNPRTIKRAINLYAILADTANETQLGTVSLDQRCILLTLSCIQVSHAYRSMFDSLTKTAHPEALLLALLDYDDSTLETMLSQPLEPDEYADIPSLLLDMGINQAVTPAIEGSAAAMRKDEDYKANIQTLAEYIFQKLCGKDGKLDKSEAELLRQLVTLSGETAVGGAGESGSSTSRRQVGFSEMLTNKAITHNARLRFQPLRKWQDASTLNWVVRPDWEWKGSHHKVIIVERGDHEQIDDSRVHLAEVTALALGKSVPSPQKYWVIEDELSIHNGKRLKDVIDILRNQGSDNS